MESQKKELLEQIEPLADSPVEYKREVQEIASYGNDEIEWTDLIPKGPKGNAEDSQSDSTS